MAMVSLASLIARLSSEEALLVLGISVCFPAFRWLLEHIVFTSLCKRALLPSGYSGKVPQKISSQMRKLQESLWKLTCYLFFVVMASSIILPKPWFWDTREYWNGWPDQDGTNILQLICLLELGYYISTAFMLAYWEIPRKDRNVMMLHHISAIALIGTCYICNYTRSGCVIMLLHDINDVIMETAKICKYVGKETLANLFFALFVSSWIALRMVAFPFVVIKSTMFEVIEVLGYHPPCYFLINTLFVLLCCIHTYWFFLISQVVWRVVVVGKVEDVREEDE